MLSDIDLFQGIISVNKPESPASIETKPKRAKTAVLTCVRALSVLRRQLRVRASLGAGGKIDHNHVFFLETGAVRAATVRRDWYHAPSDRARPALSFPSWLRPS